VTIIEASKLGACRSGLRRLKKLFPVDVELGLKDALQTGVAQDAFYYIYLQPQSEDRLMVMRAFIEDCFNEGLVGEDWLIHSRSGGVEIDLEWPSHAAHALKDWSKTREAIQQCQIS